MYFFHFYFGCKSQNFQIKNEIFSLVKSIGRNMKRYTSLTRLNTELILAIDLCEIQDFVAALM